MDKNTDVPLLDVGGDWGVCDGLKVSSLLLVERQVPTSLSPAPAASAGL